jgi:hypothetical protein
VEYGDTALIFFQIFRRYQAKFDINRDGRVTFADVFAAMRQVHTRCKQ